MNIEKISWDDVEEFCKQQIPEGSTLDYKQDFPKNLYKTIAAFANTIGGIILIGIEENDENKPTVPVKGIKFEKGLSERIYNVILTNITPPIFPEIQVCKDKSGDNAVIVIRVLQSHQTPHAINDNTQVYTRTGNKNNPETLVTIDDLFWLMSHRIESEKLRDLMISEADERFNTINSLEILNTIEASKQKPLSSKCLLTIIVCPLYPKDSFCSPPDLRSIAPKIFVGDFYGTSHHFPIENSRNRRTSKNALLLYDIFNPNSYYTELNVFGLYFYRQNLLDRFKSDGTKPEFLFRLTEVLVRLDEFIDSAIRFYNIIKYRGTLRFIFSVQNLYGHKLIVHKSIQEYSTFEKNVEYISNLTLKSLEEEKNKIIINSIFRLNWAYDVILKEKDIESILSELKSTQ